MAAAAPVNSIETKLSISASSSADSGSSLTDEEPTEGEMDTDKKD